MGTFSGSTATASMSPASTTSPSTPSAPKKMSTRMKKDIRKQAGQSLSSAGENLMARSQQQASSGADRQYHKGGMVRKTGSARLLKGEYVVPRGKVKAIRKLVGSRSPNRKSGRS